MKDYKILKQKQLFVWLLFILSSTQVWAQDTQTEGANSAHEAAKKLADPNATIGQLSIPIDYIHYNGDLTGASSQNAFKLSFQPSLPYAVKPGQNIFFRPLIPFIITQPTITDNGSFKNEGVSLGDIGFDLAYGISFPSKWMTVFGVAGSAPTASKKELGSGRWMLGPELFGGKVTNWGSIGVLVTQTWSLNKNKVAAQTNPNNFIFVNEVPYPESNTLSITSGQYMYTVNLKNAWQIQSQPVYTYNHKAAKGSKFTLPLGTGVSKTVMAGNMPLKFNLQYWYYVARADIFGPQHQVRLQIVPVIKLPW